MGKSLTKQCCGSEDNIEINLTQEEIVISLLYHNVSLKEFCHLCNNLTEVQDQKWETPLVHTFAKNYIYDCAGIEWDMFIILIKHPLYASLLNSSEYADIEGNTVIDIIQNKMKNLTDLDFLITLHDNIAIPSFQTQIQKLIIIHQNKQLWALETLNLFSLPHVDRISFHRLLLDLPDTNINNITVHNLNYYGIHDLNSIQIICT